MCESSVREDGGGNSCVEAAGVRREAKRPAPG
jgi:hypothetical protein